jgi:hypothetical protein
VLHEFTDNAFIVIDGHCASLPSSNVAKQSGAVKQPRRR